SGDYYIEIEKDNYEPARIRVTIGTHGDQLQLQLRPLIKAAGGRTAANAGPTRNAGVPDKGLEAYEKGVALLKLQGDYRAAIAQFERAIKAYPQYFEAYAQLGAAQDKLGNSAEAEQALRKSIEISGGKYAESLLLLAEVLNDQDKFGDAESVARQAA